jgi:hypothetical protein
MDKTLHADLCSLAGIGRKTMYKIFTSTRPWCNSQLLCVLVKSRIDETPTSESRRRTIHQSPQTPPSRKVSADRTPFSIALSTSAKNKCSNTAAAEMVVHVTERFRLCLAQTPSYTIPTYYAWRSWEPMVCRSYAISSAFVTVLRRTGCIGLRGD